MSASRSITVLSAMMLVAGCSRSGDFGPFVVAQVAKYGGHTRTNAVIPRLDAQWRVERDANGFQAVVTGAPFGAIAVEMEQAFGKPKLSDDGSGTLTHQPCRLWGAVDTGVAIHLIGHKNSAEIICIRGIQ